VRVNTVNKVVSAVRDNWLVGVDFIAGQVVVADKIQTWLFDLSLSRQALTVEHLGESVTTIIRVVNFTNLNSVIGQEVVHDKRQVIARAEEAKDLAILIKELFLAGDLTTTKGFFHVFLHLVVTWTCLRNLGCSELVHRYVLGGSLRCVKVIEERASVIITIGNADSTSVNTNVEANTEVLGQEGSHTVGPENHLTLEESPLRHARVFFLRLDNHNRFVLKEVVDHDLVDAIVLKTALTNGLLKETVETKDLFIKLDKSRFELLVQVSTQVVGILCVGE